MTVSRPPDELMLLEDLAAPRFRCGEFEGIVGNRLTRRRRDHPFGACLSCKLDRRGPGRPHIRGMLRWTEGTDGGEAPFPGQGFRPLSRQ